MRSRVLPCPRSAPARAAVAVALVAGVALVGGCAQRVGVSAAADAANPACAEVILDLPDRLGTDLRKVGTTSQGTAAWGSSEAAVVLRCGVEVPGPTTTRCESVQSNDVSVDWLVKEDGDGTWTFTTYGRDPAVQVTIPASISATHSSSFVTELGPAVSTIKQTRHCL